MLGRDTVPQIVAEKVGPAEKVMVVSPASLDLFGQVPTQGFIALTNNNIVFIEESGLSGIVARAYPRSSLVFQGTGYGITGKVYQFDFQGTPVKFGGLESGFEAALEKNFQTASMMPPIPTMSAPPSMPTPEPIQSPQPQPIGSPTPVRPSPTRTVPPPQNIISANYAPPIAAAPSGKSPALAAVIALVMVLAIGIIGAVFFTFAGKSKQESSTQDTASVPADVQEDEVENENAAPLIEHSGAKATSILLINASGSEIINIRKKETGKYKVWVEGTNYKGKIDSAEGKAKIKDDGSTDFIKVKAKDYGFKVTDGSDVTIIKAKVDGAGYKIKDESSTLARIKTSGDGFEVTNNSGAVIGTVTPVGKNFEVKDADGNLLYTVRGSSAKAAAVLLALKDNPMAQAGVLLYMNEF